MWDRQHGGSHRQYTRVIGKQIFRVTISYHNINDEIKPGTLESMIRQ
jgi:predicted RNA binding protein YcfA (HicA-like mRNA interferase family)